MSQFGAKPRGSASAATPGPGIGIGAESAVRRWHDESLGGEGDFFRYANGNVGAYGCGVFSDRMVAVVAGAKTRPGQWIVDAPALVFSCVFHGLNRSPRYLAWRWHLLRRPALGAAGRLARNSTLFSAAGPEGRPRVTNKSNRRGRG